MCVCVLLVLCSLSARNARSQKCSLSIYSVRVIWRSAYVCQQHKHLRRAEATFMLLSSLSISCLPLFFGGNGIEYGLIKSITSHLQSCGIFSRLFSLTLSSDSILRALRHCIPFYSASMRSTTCITSNGTIADLQIAEWQWNVCACYAASDLMIWLNRQHIYQ